MSDERLGRYRLLSLIATGGMGEVFLARQEGPAGFSKIVVVKRILRHLAKDQGFIDLFLNEAQLAAQLQHPHIAQVFGLEREGDTWFIAMEYVQGQSLRALVDACRGAGLTIPRPVAVRLISQVLQGLHFAHQLADERGRALGILHRDVSPENVLVSASGLVKLVDFGIARAMRGSETRVGQPKGKRWYMAPELMVANAPIDRRADVYSAGVLLHELLFLERPEQGVQRADGTVMVLPFVPRPELPRPLNVALLQALAPAPADRWSSALAMSDALEAWLTAFGHTVSAADITALLTRVYGDASAGARSSVVALGDEVGNTGQRAAMVGTQPLLQALDSAPVPGAASRTEPLLQIVAPPALPPRSRAGVWLALSGSVTAVVFLTLTVGAIIGSRRVAEVVSPPPGPVTAPPEPLPKVQQMPELSLEADALDAGSAQPHPAVVVKPARRVPGKTRTGKVTVRVNPWAEVSFAGKSLGVTPLPPIDVPAGLAVFTLKNPQLGVTRRVSVKVPAGGSVVLKADLFKD